MDRINLPDGTPPLAEGIIETLPGTADVKTVHVTSADEVAKIVDSLNNVEHPAAKLKPIDIKPPVPIDSLPISVQNEMKQLLTQTTDMLKPKAEPDVKVNILTPAAPNTQPELAPDPTIPMLSSCPNCGWDLSKKDTLEVTEADKQMWVRHLFGVDRFIKSYPLYGGNIVAVLRTRRTQEQDFLVNRITEEKRSGKLTAELVQYWLSRYALCLSLQSIRMGGQVYEFPELVDANGTLSMPANERFDKAIPANWPEGLTSALIHALTHFDVFTSRLTFMARDEGFFSTLTGEA